ncbi:MAG TPA: exodeoxyribonuclease VII small subunit [Candidatus Baltobacteraceae bacterium]|jgi:exodeoxyribonuclease VII small subunit
MPDRVPKTFEEKMDRIDAIVKELEAGADLDRAIALFKEGRALARECEVLLKNAQEQIEQATSETSHPAGKDAGDQIPF